MRFNLREIKAPYFLAGFAAVSAIAAIVAIGYKSPGTKACEAFLDSVKLRDFDKFKTSIGMEGASGSPRDLMASGIYAMMNGAGLVRGGILDYKNLSCVSEQSQYECTFRLSYGNGDQSGLQSIKVREVKPGVYRVDMATYNPLYEHKSKR